MNSSNAVAKSFLRLEPALDDRFPCLVEPHYELFTGILYGKNTSPCAVLYGSCARVKIDSDNGDRFPFCTKLKFEGFFMACFRRARRRDQCVIQRVIQPSPMFHSWFTLWVAHSKKTSDGWITRRVHSGVHTQKGTRWITRWVTERDARSKEKREAGGGLQGGLHSEMRGQGWITRGSSGLRGRLTERGA